MAAKLLQKRISSTPIELSSSCQF